MDLEDLTGKCNETCWAIFRIVFGILFLMHGLQKFGIIGDGAAFSMMSLMGVAGIIEIIVGILVVIGYLVRWAAILGAIQMAVAYFMVHFPQGLSPLANKGELAVLYFIGFMLLFAWGSGTWSIDSRNN